LALVVPPAVTVPGSLRDSSSTGPCGADRQAHAEALGIDQIGLAGRQIKMNRVAAEEDLRASSDP